MKKLFDIHLSEREISILQAVVNEYIVSGRPVGSRSFVQKHSLCISPATLRNIMYDLESYGFLKQPHTSSGRVPTDDGYRFYVDSLLETYSFIKKDHVDVPEEQIKKEPQLDKMFESVARMLANSSRYAGLVIPPKSDFAVIKRVELISLDNNDILAIIITRMGLVINKKVTVSNDVTQDELYKFSRFLTAELGGFSVEEIHSVIFPKLRKQSVDGLDAHFALDIAELAFREDNDSQIYIEGIDNILQINEMKDADRLLSFLHLVEEKEQLKGLLLDNLNSNGITILIGREIKSDPLAGCSIVSVPYKISNRNVGILGIVGPTRMDYERVVPVVDYASRLLSAYLTKMSK